MDESRDEIQAEIYRLTEEHLMAKTSAYQKLIKARLPIPQEPKLDEDENDDSSS